MSDSNKENKTRSEISELIELIGALNNNSSENNSKLSQTFINDVLQLKLQSIKQEGRIKEEEMYRLMQQQTFERELLEAEVRRARYFSVVSIVFISLSIISCVVYAIYYDNHGIARGIIFFVIGALVPVFVYAISSSLRSTGNFKIIK